MNLVKTVTLDMSQLLNMLFTTGRLRLLPLIQILDEAKPMFPFVPSFNEE